jgi:hypothetical protein
MKKQQKWTYPVCVEVKDTEGKVVFSAMSQVYKIGIYVIYNNNSAQQGGLAPSAMVKLMRQFKPENIKGDYTVEFGRDVTVTMDEQGFYVEV